MVDGNQVMDARTLTYEEYRKQAIRDCPELATVKDNDFLIHDYWLHGSPVDFCIHAFKTSKAYRKIAWKNRKNTHGREKS